MLLEKQNVNEEQKCWRNESEMPSSTCVRVAQLRDKFGADGAVQNVDKACSEGLTVQRVMEVLRQCYRS
jgi:hypothetical protein